MIVGLTVLRQLLRFSAISVFMLTIVASALRNVTYSLRSILQSLTTAGVNYSLLNYLSSFIHRRPASVTFMVLNSFSDLVLREDVGDGDGPNKFRVLRR